jgi:hypothetical protein
MKVLGVWLFLFACCILLSVGLDMLIGKTLWQATYSLWTSFGVMRKGEQLILFLFLLINIIPPYMNYRKNKKTYQ